MTIRRILLFAFALFSFYQNSYGDSKTLYVKYRTSPLIEGRLYKACLSVKPLLNVKIASPDSQGISRIYKIDFKNDSDLRLFMSEAKDNGDIEYLQPSVTYRIDDSGSEPKDPLIKNQWYLSDIRAFDAWGLSKGDSSIIIGLIDTGIDLRHQDLQDGVLKDLAKNFIDPDSTVNDDNGHGTEIAGIMNASWNGLGISGIAPKCRLLPIKAFDSEGQGTDETVSEALLYAVDRGCRIINMSFGDTTASLLLRDLLEYAASKAVVLIASSGNRGDDKIHFPSGFSSVISVGASDRNDMRASFSSYGSRLDLLAPGSGIYTTAPDNSYTEVSGTSASAPMVSAASALMLSMKKDLQPDAIRGILRSSSRDIGPLGWDDQSGSGLLDLFNCLTGLAPETVEFTSPRQQLSTNLDSVEIRATVVSPRFQAVSLWVGSGTNPEEFTEILPKSYGQFIDKKMLRLDISKFKEGTYCLRLLVDLLGGSTRQERLIFNVERTAPSLLSGDASLAYDGLTRLAKVTGESDQKVLAELFVRSNSSFEKIQMKGKSGSTADYYDHGFSASFDAAAENELEYYLTLSNQAGLKSRYPASGSYRVSTAGWALGLNALKKLPLNLASGNIYGESASFRGYHKAIILNKFGGDGSGSDLYCYDFFEGGFTPKDSLKNRLPKAVISYANDSRGVILSSFLRNFYIDRQSVSSSGFENVYSDTSGNFWYSVGGDFHGDGGMEILGIGKNSRAYVFNLMPDMRLVKEAELSLNSDFNSNAGCFGRMTPGGKNIIWISDGVSVYGFKAEGKGSYSPYINIMGDPETEDLAIAMGNFLSADKKELAVFIRKASTSRLLIYGLVNDAPVLLDSLVLITPDHQGDRVFKNDKLGLKFTDIDSDGIDELMLYSCGKSYLLKSSSEGGSVVYFKDNLVSGNSFSGDLLSDGSRIVSFSKASGQEFYLYNKDSLDYGISGCSLRNENDIVRISGLPLNGPSYIYRGENKNSLSLIGSSSAAQYIDSIGSTKYGVYYYYYLSRKNEGRSVLFREPSGSVFYHKEPVLAAVSQKGPKNIRANFSGRMPDKKDLKNYFSLTGYGSPVSTASESDSSIFLSFSSAFKTGSARLSTNGLLDYYGSPVKDDSLDIDLTESNRPESGFIISNFSLISPHDLKIYFNLDLDSSSLKNALFKFSPDNRAERIVRSSPKELTIRLKYPVGSIGRLQNLSINGLFSSVETGHLEINQEKGNNIQIGENAANLDSFYAYPNPVRSGQGITFANLPKNVEILLFSVSGLRIRTINSNASNGGVFWDLKDNNGKAVPSGIYILRVRSFNENGSELQSAIRKIAVVN